MSQHWPASTLPPEYASATGAHVHLKDPYGGYGVQVEIEQGAGVIVGPRPVALDELVHPFVTYLAIVAGRLLGREALHAGAFVRGGGAWALLSPPGAGKSTTLAALHTAGATVVADDLVLVDQRDQVLSGPRCLDLRESESEAAVPVRRPMRRRVTLAPAPASVPLHGLIYLDWGAQARLLTVSPAERLERLDAYRRWGEGSPLGPERALGLAAIPMFELSRARGPDGLQSAVRLLLESPLLARP